MNEKEPDHEIDDSYKGGWASIWLNLLNILSNESQDSKGELALEIKQSHIDSLSSEDIYKRVLTLTSIAVRKSLVLNAPKKALRLMNKLQNYNHVTIYDTYSQMDPLPTQMPTLDGAFMTDLSPTTLY